MDNKPNVFPSNIQPQSEPTIIGSTQVKDKNAMVDADYEAKKMEMAEIIYTNSMSETGMSDAIEEMRKRTEEQIKRKDEQLKKNLEQTQNYQTMFNEAQNKPVNQKEEPKVNKTVLTTEPKSPINTTIPKVNMNNVDPYIQQLSQPQFNTSFDVIPLPSEGKLYRNRKSSVRVAYLTTADENILTSPNLLQSGEFLEILINRKLLESDLRYRDLHVGDRNAIMLWLRATGYGEMYPVTLFDENDEPFDTEINLNELKIKKLNVEPDEEGLFAFMLPVSKYLVKFKLLTVGDLEDIEKLADLDKENKVPVNNLNTYTLERQIVEINGERNPVVLKDMIHSLRIKDAKDLREYINKIDCGIDLELEVQTPRGGSIKTFLPLNVKFFWPDLSV